MSADPELIQRAAERLADYIGEDEIGNVDWRFKVADPMRNSNCEYLVAGEDLTLMVFGPVYGFLLKVNGTWLQVHVSELPKSEVADAEELIA